MKNVLKRALGLILALCLILAGSAAWPGPRARAYTNPVTTVKIGLYYGSDAMAAANLQNYAGSGFSFGYFDPDRVFHTVGETDETKITMLKDWTMYLSGGVYSDSQPSGSYDVVGCYHVCLNESCGDFAAAKRLAGLYTGGFPAYHNGKWVACVGSYTSQAAAETALVERGLNGKAMTASSGCVTVVATGTTRILFQFDYGTAASLAVRPRADGSGTKPLTWFKGYRYYGAFQYTRIGGGNMNVINVLDIEDYIKGVVPYEMSSSWPLEALKAQAICARTYAASYVNHHGSQGFDLCCGDDCQVYRGTNNAADNTNRAVEETAGQYITYNGSLCQIFYFSSDGGATEDSENVFTEALPYLRGVEDPWEQYVYTGKASWSCTYTLSEITHILQAKGYRCAQIVSVTPSYTRMGNIASLKFTDSNGKNWTFTNYSAGSILYSASYGKYIYSMRFTITPEGDLNVTVPLYYVNGSGDTVAEDAEVFAVGSGGVAEQVELDGAAVMTSAGLETLAPASVKTGGSSDTYVVKGSGWGHNVGMSQYGAKAMADQGYTYEDILKFYFTGVEIG